MTGLFPKHGALILALAAALASVQTGDDKKPKPAPVVASFWNLDKAGAITIIAAGFKGPQPLIIQPDTLIVGICRDCMIPMQFKAGETDGYCTVCGCRVSNAGCIAGQPVEPPTLGKMLQALPPGTMLRIAYREAGKPESGVKTLSVDRKTVYLPVEGLSAMSVEALGALLKPVGGTRPSLSEDGKRLTFTVGDWTPKAADALEHGIAEAGGKISRPEKPSKPG